MILTFANEKLIEEQLASLQASLIAFARTPGPQKYVCCHAKTSQLPVPAFSGIVYKLNTLTPTLVFSWAFVPGRYWPLWIAWLMRP